MNSEKVKSFIYYGAENYSSIQSLRQMVPQCCLFLTFLTVSASLIGNVFAFGIVTIAITLLYTLIIYTFHIWCPKPSFSCRFATSAMGMIVLSFEIQMIMYAILYAGKYMDFWDIALILGLQIISVAVYIFITVRKIKNGKYIDKKGRSSVVNNAVIASASFFGYFLVRMISRNVDIDNSVAATVIIAIFTALAVLFDIFAAFHLLKYYYAKKYQITCDENGETVSKMLIMPPKKEKSLVKKILKAILWGLLIILMIAVLYGMYQTSR